MRSAQPLAVLDLDRLAHVDPRAVAVAALNKTRVQEGLAFAGEVKLTDFGIAKLATQKSVFYRVKGKVGYMSPEQARGEKLDQRSDLFSLAVCLYEALVGERLFVADLLSTASMIYAQPIRAPFPSRWVLHSPPAL